MNIEYIIEVALSNANVGAGLHVIRAAEGTLGEDGYRALYGWHALNNPHQLFDSFADHPRQSFTTPWGNTSAAGAYQAMGAVPGKVKTDTWGDFLKACGPHDFSPLSQDQFAIWCIHRAGALDDLLAGRFDAFIAKCAPTWASLPGSPYGQPTRSMEYCRQVYRDAGGVMAAGMPAPEQPAAPIEDHSPTGLPPAQQERPMPIFLALLPALLELVPQLVGIFGKGPRGQANAAAAQAVTDAVTKATGSPNLQGAIEAMQSEPAIKAAAVAAVLADPIVSSLMEVGGTGGGIDLARKAAADPAAPPFWQSAPFYVGAFLIPLVYMVVYKVMWDARFTEQLQTVVVTAILSGLLASITGFYFGSAWAQRNNPNTVKG